MDYRLAHKQYQVGPKSLHLADSQAPTFLGDSGFLVAYRTAGAEELSAAIVG